MTLLRLAYFVPALADFLLAGLTLFRMAGVSDASLVPRAQFAAVTFCWGLFLLAGMARPVERAWALPPTALVIGLIATGYGYGFTTGHIEPWRLLAVLVASAAMIGLCTAGYRTARRMA